VQLLLLESLTPFQLEIVLNHQAFTFYERALRFPADNFPLQQLASRPVQPRLKKRSTCSLQENQAPREKLILCPSAPPWTPPKKKLTVNTFIEGCSRSDPGRSNTAIDFLRSLPTFDVVVWTNDSVPSPLRAGGAGVQAVCRRCSSSLSYSADPVSSSLSAESLALVRGLEWCHFHLKSCHFQCGPFPNRFLVGPYPPRHGPRVSPTKVLPGYLGPF